MIGKEQMLAVEQFMLRVAVPVLEDTPKGLDHIGTGTLFELEGRSFLITARHIFDDVVLEKVGFPYNPIKSDLYTLGCFDLYKPTDENIDISVLELREQATIAHIKRGWRLLTLANVAEASPKGTFIICGYPSRRFKVAGDRIGGLLMTAYTERLPDVPPGAEQPVDSRLDLFFSYDNEAIDINGKTIESPHLKGASGTSIWEYREPDGGAIWTPESTLKVVGIQSSFLPGKFARAKSWEFVRVMLRNIITGNLTPMRAVCLIGSFGNPKPSRAR